MRRPLAVVEGKDGVIRDVHGRPVIVVFDSKQKSSHRKSPVVDRQEEETEDVQPLEFVQVARPTEEDAVTRTLIRTHVMADYKRKRMLHKAKTARKQRTLGLSRSSQISSAPVVFSPLGTKLNIFNEYPVQMQPYMHRLVQHCKYDHLDLTLIWPSRKTRFLILVSRYSSDCARDNRAGLEGPLSAGDD